MSDNEEVVSQENLYCSPIADPLMGGKLEAKALKLIKKAAGAKNIRRGVPEVVKALRKGQKGVVIFAADVFPVDVLAHVPVFCEEKNILYAFVSSRQMLGAACQTKRAASCILVQAPKDDSAYTKTFEQVAKGIKAVHRFM